MRAQQHRFQFLPMVAVAHGIVEQNWAEVWLESVQRWASCSHLKKESCQRLYPQASNPTDLLNQKKLAPA